MIYIVEDDENMCEIETYALKNIGYDVATFTKKVDLYNALRRKAPELIILDIMLGEESGGDILMELKKDNTYMNIPIIMVTAKNMEIEKVKLLDAGADDYTTKPFGIMEFVSRVNAVLRRFNVSEHFKSAVMSFDCITIDESKREVKVENNICEFTYKEFELLKYLILNKGIVLSREQIMENIWGFDYQGESRTVDMHIKTIRQKLGEKGKLIKTVRNVGYKIG